MTRYLLRSCLIGLVFVGSHALASAAPPRPLCSISPIDICLDGGCSQFGRCVTDITGRRCVCQLTIPPDAAATPVYLP